jgi:hypothetical protein
MKQHFDLLGVWLLSIATFLTSSEVIGFFAIAASVTTIVSNMSGVIKFFNKYIKNEK